MLNSGDTTWMLVSSGLVMLMTPGLAFFYGGLAPSKNVLNTLKMSFFCLAVIPLIWFFLGYSFAFATGNSFIGGLEYFGLHGIGQTVSEGSTVPDYAFVIFQIY